MASRAIQLHRSFQDDENVPDSDQDIRPRHHRARMHGAGDGESDDEDEDPMADWNIRKCSAAALDQLSNVFKDDILAWANHKINLDGSHFKN